MNTEIKILFVEDVAADVIPAIRELENADIKFTHQLVNNEKDFIEALTSFKPNLIISDYSLQQFDGMAVLKILKKFNSDIPFILLTSSVDEQTAIECMKAGADDYILKDHLNRLSFSVKNLLENVAFKKEKILINNELRLSETSYHTLFDKARDGILILDLKGNIIDLNEAFAEMHGYTVDELMKIGLRDLDPNITEEFWENSMKTMLEKGSIQLEVEHYHKNGSLLTFDVIANIVDVAGEKYNMAFHRNITDRKKIEKALHEQEFHSQSLLRLSHNLESALTYAEAINAARNEIKTVIGYQNLWVYVLSEDKKYLKALVADGEWEQTIMSEEGTATLTIEGDRMLEEIASAKDIVVVEDARTDERTNKEIVAKMELRTIVNIPIILFDKHLGALGTGTFGDEGVRAPTISEQKYLRTLSSHMAVTLDRIRLFIEYKRTEKALKQSEQLLREFQRITYLGNFVWDISAGSWKNSEILDQILGIDENYERSFAGWKKLVHPDWLNLLSDYISTQVLKNHLSFDKEFKIIRQDNGQQSWVRGFAEIELDDKGEPKRLIGTVKDINERKQMEETLKESEEKFSKIFHKSPIAILISSLPEGIIIDVNEKIFDLAGYTRTEMIGRSIIEMNLWADLSSREKYISLLQEKGSVRNFEATFNTKSGDIRYTILSGEFIELKGEKYLLTVVRNITDRKKAENLLRESEEKFSKIFHNSPDVILISSILKGIFIEINDKVFDLVGYTRSEIIGNSVIEMKLWTDLSQRDKYISIIQEKGSVNNFEASFTTKSGDIKQTIMSGQFIEIKGEKYLITTIRDISDRKKAEQEIIKLNRLYYLISEVNQLVLKSASQDEIFLNVCRITVEQGKFRMAWIGLVNEINESINPVKWYGYEKGYLKSIKISTKENSFGIGPSGRAYRTSHYAVSNDIANDPFMVSWRNEALKRNYQSSITLPIIVQGKTIAVFTIYATEKFFFNESEIKLLENVTGNISYALDNILIKKLQQQSEIEIHKAKERYDLVIKATHDMVWDIDFIKNKIYRDGNFMAMGFPLSGLFNENVWEKILHSEDKERVLKKYNQVVFHSKATAWKDEYRCIKANGEIAYVLDKGFILRDEHKKPIRMVGAMTDITQRKNAEESVVALNLQLQESIKNITDYKYAIDQSIILSIADVRGDIIYVNDNFLKFSKYSVKELIGQNHRIINSGFHPKEYFRNLWETISKGNVWRGETRNRAKDGTIFWCDNTIVPFLDESGKPYQYVSFKKDITAKKNIEIEIADSHDQLRNLASHLQGVREEERADMAREIHDELGQQLTVLKMDISFIKNKILPISKEVSLKMKNTLDLIDETIKTVRKISTNLRPSILDDLGLAEAFTWYCQEFETRSGIRTELISSLTDIELAPNLSIALFRIFQESLTNVARYSKAKKVTVTLQKVNEQLELKVIDDGIGFDLNAIKDKKTLGLVGIKERTLMMNGNFEIITTPGKGTTNIVTIPLETNKTELL